MLILSLDTTSDTASVALTQDDRVLSYEFLSGAKKHSETILVQINHLLSVCGYDISQIDAFAVTVGPGSFTGVRIGVSTVKGLAFASQKPCIEVSALEALAYQLRDLQGILVPVMDARRNQFYHAFFLSDCNGLQRLTQDDLMEAKQIQTKLSEFSDSVVYFAGDGYTLAKKVLFTERNANTPVLLQRLNAASVGLLAFAQIQQDRGVTDDRNISPRYLRASQAERERIEKEKKETT